MSVITVVTTPNSPVSSTATVLATTMLYVKVENTITVGYMHTTLHEL